MRIAVLTTHRANNFGAQLQAYALVFAIQKLGHECEVLDWRSPYFEKTYHSFFRWCRNPLFILHQLLSYFTEERETRKRFKHFRDGLPKSAAYKTKLDLRAAESKYDCFVVGSDQVWNPVTTGGVPENFDRTFFLDFVGDDDKKVGYAISIGKDKIDCGAVIHEIQALAKRFRYVTMREAAGASFVGDLIQRDIPVVLDPVLLHGQDFWSEVSKQACTKIHDRYVLVYDLQNSSFMREKVKSYALTRNLKIVEVKVPLRSKDTQSEYIRSVGPVDFLWLIKNAESVFTNSFHGAAFSILFCKDLVLEIHNISGRPNSRFETLLSLGNLHTYKKEYASDRDRCLYCFEQVDFDRINAAWASAREASLCQLEHMLTGGRVRADGRARA